MPQNLRLSDSALLKLEQDLTGSFESVKAQVHALQSAINSTEGTWKGVASHAFDTKQQEINQSMRRIGVLLLRFQEGIKAFRTVSGNNEDEIRQSLQGIDVVGGHSGDASATATNRSNLSTY
ncbi:WXG100 family type VII secretion target [Streptomyces sp. NPDC060194]|uniref:WXG100 family type VII secretion target n=1 Tax=Streptomyces sp. NPDC060194 TaxID=3347069 RepID=UPI00365F3572